VLADWWQEFSTANDALREDMVAQVREEQHKGARRVHRVKPAVSAADGEVREARARSGAGSQDTAEAEGQAPGEGGEGEASSAPKKRRRRRRKPAGEGGGAPAAGGEA
jgi:poly(A) polymerase